MIKEAVFVNRRERSIRGKENGRGKSKGTGTEKKKVRRTEEETDFPGKDRSCRRNCFDRNPYSSGAGS